ncbi:putative aquaporin-10 [Apostichopus japonicus]|uniref:Putative aquaporin-10 n=1 Tax=Stichopus japonicus TaxID=307972 RepID=A0A2G8K937_STIJA|nr:putative aquaporin-10 [Apostichopus japonicus]
MSIENFVENLKGKLAIQNDLFRCLLSEFLGTFILVVLADGALASLAISGSDNHLWAAFGVGFAVAFGIWTALGVSGGHVNPAVSLGLAVTGKFPMKRFLPYCLAQCSGAFVASVVCYSVYYDGVKNAVPIDVDNHTAACGIFTTFPGESVGYTTAFFDQIITTGLLIGLLLALLDKRNMAPDLTLVPLSAGILVSSIILSYGVNTGAPLNPARDFAGRIMCTLANYGPEVWLDDGKHWWLIPTFGPLVGSVVGAWTYMLCIEIHHPNEETEEASRKEIDVLLPIPPPPGTTALADALRLPKSSKA